MAAPRCAREKRAFLKIAMAEGRSERVFGHSFRRLFQIPGHLLLELRKLVAVAHRDMSLRPAVPSDSRFNTRGRQTSPA